MSVCSIQVRFVDTLRHGFGATIYGNVLVGDPMRTPPQVSCASLSPSAPSLCVLWAFFNTFCIFPSSLSLSSSSPSLSPFLSLTRTLSLLCLPPIFLSLFCSLVRSAIHPLQTECYYSNPKLRIKGFLDTVAEEDFLRGSRVRWSYFAAVRRVSVSEWVPPCG